MTTTEESGLLAHARRELDIVDPPTDAAYDGMLRRAVLDVVRVFARQGHSGMSAATAIALLEKLLRYEPLSPLTGADDEWRDVSQYNPGGDPVAQNIRCSRVMLRRDGSAFDVEGRVFEDPDGSRWTNGDSHVDVTFPYTPTREVVKRTDATDEPEHAGIDGERPFREQTAREAGLAGNPR